MSSPVIRNDSKINFAAGLEIVFEHNPIDFYEGFESMAWARK